MTLFVFRELNKIPWFKVLVKLNSVYKNNSKNAKYAYSKLFAALLEAQAQDLTTALSKELFWISSSLATAAINNNISASLRTAALYDLKELCKLVKKPWHKKLKKSFSDECPVLENLISLQVDTPLKQHLNNLREAILNSDFPKALQILEAAYQHNGTGELANYWAFRYQTGKFKGIKHLPKVSFEQLVGLERQINQITNNTKAFIEKRSSQHVLLYGERGSGKSTVVRSLLKLYADKGLRLIEIPPASLKELNEVVEHLRSRPHKYIIFVDDLNFEANDQNYQPLKSLLEGSLTEPADNIVLYATSNRRHLIKEQFSDRPDPLNDDVHAWDTFNERLALADRFGLTITFPSTDQKRYLLIVKELAARANLVTENSANENIEQKAIHFAQWGNGYTGRTAQQFVSQMVNGNLE